MPPPPGVVVWSTSDTFVQSSTSTQTVFHTLGTVPPGNYGPAPMLMVTMEMRILSVGAGCAAPSSATPSISVTFPSETRRMLAGFGSSFLNPRMAPWVNCVADGQFSQGATIQLQLDFSAPGGDEVEFAAAIVAALIADTPGTPTTPSATPFPGFWIGTTVVSNTVFFPQSNFGSISLTHSLDPFPFITSVHYGSWTVDAASNATTIDEGIAGWYHVGTSSLGVTQPVSGDAVTLRASLGFHVPQAPPQLTGLLTPGSAAIPFEISPLCHPGEFDLGQQTGVALRVTPPDFVPQHFAQIIG